LGVYEVGNKGMAAGWPKLAEYSFSPAGRASQDWVDL
jgi:hypothetical protein